LKALLKIILKEDAEKAATNAPKLPHTEGVGASENTRKKVSDNNPILIKMWLERTALYTERARLSNSMHQIPLTERQNMQRAGVIDEIKRVQTRLKAVSYRIEYFEANGRMPNDAAQKDRYHIPDDMRERDQKRRSVTSMLSMARKKDDKINITYYAEYLQLIEDSYKMEGIVIKKRVGGSLRST
jgi:K+-sensing histidine kinase KdpD